MGRRADARREDAGRNSRRALLRAAPALLAMLVLAVAALWILPNAQMTGGGNGGVWPRPYDPAKPFNMDGVPGVTAAQRERAEDLLVRSLENSRTWADIDTALAAGWFSLGDDNIGLVHLVNPDMIFDGKLFDPEYPESLVYLVQGEKRIFAAYMFMADPDTPLDDPRIIDFAGPLMEWHNHDDLCFVPVESNPFGRIMGLVNDRGECDFPGAKPAVPRHPLDPLAGDVESPLTSVVSLTMTHVWVVPHECGPFSAIGPVRCARERRDP